MNNEVITNAMATPANSNIDRLLFGPEMDDATLTHAGTLLADQKEATIQTCLDVLDDSTLYLASAPGEGCAPINAIKLLHLWRVTEALPRLWYIIRMEFVGLNIDEAIQGAAVQALSHWGPEAVDCLFDIARYDRSVDEAQRCILALFMAHNGSSQLFPEVYAWMKVLFLRQVHRSTLAALGPSLLRFGGEDAVAFIEAHALNDDRHTDEIKDMLRRNIQDFRAGHGE